MKLAFYIARRYLFAKKSHNAINIISMVSVCGVVVATTAMICALSVFNGFKGLAATMFSLFDPELKIALVEGKVFDPTIDAMRQVYALPEVSFCCETLQENALVRYGDRQEISVVKGVDSSFRHLALIDTAIFDGTYLLQEGDFNYTVLGIGLASSLGVNAGFVRPVEICMPKRDQQVNMANPAASLLIEYVYIGGVYYINQPMYDEGFMLVPIDLLRSMLRYEKEVTALELKLASGADLAATKKKISRLLGDGYTVKDRYEQQEASFKMVQMEKWVTYLILCFILVLTLFNLLGSLAMLMIEKEEDVKKLRSMGADNRLINRIFLFEGWMISLLGAVIGVAIGIALCFLQQRFGLIRLGETAGTFVVDAYPVVVEWTDVLLAFMTVVTIGFFAVLYPVHYLGKKWLNKGVAACLLLPLLISCGGQKKENRTDAAATSEAEIAVTIEPLRYFAEKIAGDETRFFSVVPVGQSPETYDPSPREMIRVGKSAAYFHLGQLPLEQVLIKAVEENQTKTRLCNLSEGMVFHACEEDSHSHHCAHGSHDPHIWVSFAGARAMSANICQAMSQLHAEKKAIYQSNYQHVQEELDLLEKTLHEQLDTLSCRAFVIYHPALTYFAEEFGLTQYGIEEDGKEPSPAMLKEMIEKARAAQVKVVFVQMEFDSRHAAQIAAEIGARTVVINPLDYAWDEQMKRIAKALVTHGEID